MHVIVSVCGIHIFQHFILKTSLDLIHVSVTLRKEKYKPILVLHCSCDTTVVWCDVQCILQLFSGI